MVLTHKSDSTIEGSSKEQTTVLDPKELHGILSKQLHGKLVQPSDANYDKARLVYNGMIDKRPHLIAYCADVADVITTVNFAREHHLLTAVRGGGHNGGGLGVCDHGIVIDLSLMHSVRVDPKSKTARVEGGAVWRDVDHATHAFGLATPGGFFSSTGVGGLSLGGGLGYLNRKHGLVIDNLLEADVVLASGEFVTASEQENSDLFWAIRGGGGNFGIIVSFLFQLHPLTHVYAGPTLWPLEQSKEIIRWYCDFMLTAREDLSGFFGFLAVPPSEPFPAELHNKVVCAVIWCYSGPDEEENETFAPILKVGTPLLHGVHKLPYPAFQMAFDKVYPPGLQMYWKADVFDTISDEMIDEMVKFAEIPSLLSTMHIYALNGAVHRVDSKDTAFRFRSSNYNITILAVDNDSNNNDKIIKWARDYYDALHRFSVGGAYLNMTVDNSTDKVQESYGENYSRLVEIKRKYDPTNFFRVNQNINPNT